MDLKGLPKEGQALGRMKMNERNLVQLHHRQAERLGPRPALRYKGHGLWHDLTWEQYRAESLAAAAALVEYGIAPGDRIGVVAENSVDWLIADMAILAAGAVNVPPHAPLTARQIHFQLADAEINFLFVSNRAQLDKVRQIRGQLPPLRGLVVFDGSDNGRSAVMGCVPAAGPASVAARCGGAGSPRGGPGTRRSGDDHVHLRHDRQSHGRDADARQSAEQRPLHAGAFRPTA
jgi:acyl-CoA synthetase (AMP-forming)/AMP-acid ligase II